MTCWKRSLSYTADNPGSTSNEGKTQTETYPKMHVTARDLETDLNV